LDTENDDSDVVGVSTFESKFFWKIKLSKVKNIDKKLLIGDIFTLFDNSVSSE